MAARDVSYMYIYIYIYIYIIFVSYIVDMVYVY